MAIARDIVSIDGTRPQASWNRIGRYLLVGVPAAGGVGAWLGTHLGLWKSFGSTPLWLLFSEGKWGRAKEVREFIEPWAEREGYLTAMNGSEFAVALEMPVGEEKAEVIRSLVDDLSRISTVLNALPPGATGDQDLEEEGEVS